MITIDLVEHLGVVGVVQRRQPVRQPGDRVRLARPGRVLHQIVVARPLARGRRPPGGSTASHWWNRGKITVGEPSSPSRLLDVDEPAEEVQPRVALPDLAPTGTPCGDSPRAGGLPAPVAVALVERQEPRVALRRGGWSSPRRSVSTAKCTTARRSQRHVRSGPDPCGTARWRARRVWPVSGFFNSAVATGMPFTNRHQIERLGRARLGTEAGGSPSTGSPRTGPPAPGSARAPGGSTPAGSGLLDPRIDHTVAQHVDRAPLVELLRQPIEELPLRSLRRTPCSFDQPSPTRRPASPR